METNVLTIQQMIFSRLPYLSQTDDNKALIDNFVLETMYELEVCFNVSNGGADESNIGDESKYSFLQKMIIADLVCVQLLMNRMIKESVASEESTGEVDKFLKSTKAGSVEVEWEQVDPKKGAMFSSGTSTMEYYRKSAIRKAAQLGCLLDICDGCVQAVLESKSMQSPFIVVTSEGCGCSGSSIKEQG